MVRHVQQICTITGGGGGVVLIKMTSSHNIDIDILVDEYYSKELIKFMDTYYLKSY